MSVNSTARPFLPLGSVILLKGAPNRLMICGRLQREVASQALFDYCGVLYPQGMISSSSVYMFNHEDIERVFFLGMQDSEEFEFSSLLMDRAAELKLSA